MTDHGLLHSLGQVVPQMPPIGHLHRIRRSDPNTFGISAGPVPAHHLDTGMLKQPGRDGARGAVGEQIYRTTGGHVHHDRAIHMPAADREVVDPENRHLPDRPGGYRAHCAQQGVPADGNPEMVGESGSGPAGDGQSDRSDHCSLYRRSSRPRLCQIWDLFGESLCRAVDDVAEEAADPDVDQDWYPAGRCVGELSSVPGMDSPPQRGH